MTTAGPSRVWFRDLVVEARPRRLLSMLDFAERYIVLPNGPAKGRRFRADRQPYARRWFEGVDSGDFQFVNSTGPSQSGKTLLTFVIPILYYLFEVRETVIAGAPNRSTLAEKWTRDLRPTILASPELRLQIPSTGPGSKGGSFEEITFENGEALKFMAGGGDDKQRAHYTARVVVLTETDGLDEVGGTSREGDKIAQFIARTRAFGKRKRVFMECTVSTEDGRTWHNHTKTGTGTEVAVRCPHCLEYAVPKRENLTGWEGAASVIDADRDGRWTCGECAAVWTEDDRVQANEESVSIHRGQVAKSDGTIEGDAPDTNLFSFRWTATHNLFVSAGDVASDEWTARERPDQDAAETEMRQFIWALPSEPKETATIALDVRTIIARTSSVPRGIVPRGTSALVLAIDIGQYLHRWNLLAFRDGGSGGLVDFGEIEVGSGEHGVERAILLALREFRDQTIANGWPDQDGTVVHPAAIWVDSGWKPDPVYLFCRESGTGYLPTKGFGAGQQAGKRFVARKATGGTVKTIGAGYHVAMIKAGASSRTRLVEIDADRWKSFAHDRLATPVDSPGAVLTFDGDPRDLIPWARQVCAEEPVEEYDPKLGLIRRWQRRSRANHYLDTFYLACAAAHFCGVRLLGDEGPPRPAPGGGKWFASQRATATKRRGRR